MSGGEETTRQPDATRRRPFVVHFSGIPHTHRNVLSANSESHHPGDPYVVVCPRKMVAHERIALWPLRDGRWVAVTPDRDVYGEDLLR